MSRTLELTFSDGIRVRLNKLQRQSQSLDRIEVIRKALALYELLLNEHAKGRHTITMDINATSHPLGDHKTVDLMIGTEG